MDLSLLVEALSEGVLLYDSDGRLCVVNGSARRMLGLPLSLAPEALSAEQIIDHVADRTEHVGLARSALCAPDVPAQGLEIHLTNPEQWVSCDHSLSFDKQDRVVARLVVLRDCLEMERHNAAWRQRLRATVHDLRSPLTNMKAYSQLALMRLQTLPDETRAITQVTQTMHCLEVINAQANAMAALLTHSLD